MSSKKVVSLLPAATEIVCALGLENLLVGRSHDCDYPESVKALPVCSSPRFDTSVSGEETHLQVKELVSTAGSLYKIDEEKILSLAPDLILIQDQCAVCAVGPGDLKGLMPRLAPAGTEAYSIHPSSLEEVFECVSGIAGKLGVADRGEELVDELRERTEIIRHKLQFVEDRPTVACIEWLSPLMTAGNWTPGLISLAGGTPVLSKAGEESGTIEFDELKGADPDILVISVCGYTIERTVREIGALFNLAGWTELKAVQNNQVYLADGNRYFNRPSPALVDTVEILAEIIQPKYFVFGMEGTAWVKFGV